MIKKLRIHKRISKEKVAGALAFWLPVLVMLAIFVTRKIYPFGKRSFLCTDMYHQYMPFFTQFMRALRSGQGLAYTWDIGIGSNFLALYVYYLASPFHWLGLLIPESHIMEFLTYLVVTKIGLTGLSAFWYFKKKSPENLWAALAFSQCYALSGFMAAYNWNIMWLDCVILLPLIVFGLERLVLEGKPVMYCVTLALSIYTNYYISIMICIFLVLYFLYLYFAQRRPVICLTGQIGQSLKRQFAPVGRFALYSVLAAGMAAVLLIPEVCAILQTDFGDISFPKKIETYFPIFDMITRHCVGVSVEKGLAHWPNIYCGVGIFLFLPVYLLHEKIPAREKFGKMVIAGLLLLGFNTSVLNFIWHGLNYPDSLPARQAFLYIFLLLSMGFDAFCHLDFADAKQKHLILKVYLMVAATLVIWEKFVDSEAIDAWVFPVTFLFVTLYAAVCYLMFLYRRKGSRIVMTSFLLAVVTAELFVNTYTTSVTTVNRDSYLEHQKDYRELAQKAQAAETDGGIVRVEKFNRKTKNDGALAGYTGASVFSSTLNSQVMDLYKKLGMRHSKVFYDSDGATPLVAAMLNIRYMMADSAEYEGDLYTIADSQNGVYLYRANHTLPFGFVAPLGFAVPEEYAGNGLHLQNELVHQLGIAEDLFRLQFSQQVGNDVQITCDKAGVYYAVLTSSGTKKVRVSGSRPGGMEWKDLKTQSVICLGSAGEGDTITLSNSDKDDDTPEISAEIYYMDPGVLKMALEILSWSHLEGITYDSTHVSGRITLGEYGRLILPIPYEKGWTVFVNGEKTEPSLFGGVLMELELYPGQYEIELRFVPYGRTAGILVSLVSAAVFVGIWRFKKFCLQRKK